MDRHMTTVMDSLVAAGARAADKAALLWLDKHGLRETVDAQALADALNDAILAALKPALADAGEALACGMIKIAEMTFTASMALAGIGAAKKATGSVA